MIEAKSVWQEWEHNLEEYTLDRVSEITEVPADKIEEAVRTYTTRLNPLHATAASTTSWPPTRRATPCRTPALCSSLPASPATPTSPPATAAPRRPR